ncbi:DUF1360 domain-containing protein [Nocardioides dongkuii]|uniref:DUF1360 domain-containing protein n=1 Tax=Nocardioides dongkuii TaxID=2760089 RepID=UPI0015FA90B2|nr:DUF1360 domain-containing protein [Nocardioides dongkuii]
MSGSPRDPHRIAGYAGAMSVFTSAVAGAALAARRTGKVPERYSVLDLALGAVATHKLARIVSKEGVTTPIRAPFTEFEGEAGSAELTESPKDGAGHTVGELLTCPFCLAPWIASGYVAALALAPNAARAWAATFSVVGGSDFLQHAYARTRGD